MVGMPAGIFDSYGGSRTVGGSLILPSMALLPPPIPSSPNTGTKSFSFDENGKFVGNASVVGKNVGSGVGWAVVGPPLADGANRSPKLLTLELATGWLAEFANALNVGRANVGVGVAADGGTNCGRVGAVVAKAAVGFGG